jgi:H+/Cl- antiporter ClcA
LGGSISYKLGRIFHLDEKDMRIITLCGMSAVFAALFGTPLTATIFAMEVISVGIIYYSSFVPCIFSSLVAYGISLLFGAEPVRYVLKTVQQTSIITIIQIVIIAVLSAGVSIAFSVILHKTHSICFLDITVYTVVRKLYNPNLRPSLLIYCKIKYSPH